MGKMSLKLKMYSMFGFAAFMLVLVGGLGFYGLNKVAYDYDHIAEVNYPNSVTILKMQTEVKEMFYILTQLTLNGNDEKEIDRLVGKYQKAKEEYTRLDAVYTALDFVEGEEPLYLAMDKAWNENLKFADEALVLAKTASESPADRVSFGNMFRGDFRKARNEFYKTIADLTKFQEDEAKKWGELANKESTQQKTASSVIVGIGFVLTILAGFFFTRSLSNTLNAVAENLTKGSLEVNEAATEIASSSESLSSSTSQLASSVQETSASVEELTAMVAKNAENSDKSKDKATSSQDVAQKGKQAVVEMMGAIQDINESNSEIMRAVEESNNNISEITKVIADIGAKTKVINDIVFQTKLLSFNASVEAARAGEHGKGFSVVAEEVGNLAQMSGNAAQEISAMLDASVKKVENIVTQTKQKVEVLIKTGKEKVEKGQSTAAQCEDSLNQIVEEVEQVSQMVAEISTASKEQSVGIQEITKAMSQMDVVTQQNANASQTAASASVQLAGQSESLSGVVSELQTLIYGQAQPQVNSKRKVSAPVKKTDLQTTNKTLKVETAEKIEKKSKVIPLPLKAKKTFKAAAGDTSSKKLTANGQEFPKSNDPRFDEF